MTTHPARASRTVRGLTVLLATLALASAACGGAADSAPAKAPAQEQRDRPADDELPEPRTIEEAQDRIARARVALEGKGDAKAASEAPRAERLEPPSPSPQGGASPQQDRDSVCGSPCRALASMKRAVEALCRMTGDTDNRCVDAKRTLDESTNRVASCRCEGS